MPLMILANRHFGSNLYKKTLRNLATFGRLQLQPDHCTKNTHFSTFTMEKVGRIKKSFFEKRIYFDTKGTPLSPPIGWDSG